MLALLNVEHLIASGGLTLLALFVFAESGMLVGFFLPGDSLLFIAGFVASKSGEKFLMDKKLISPGEHALPAIGWVILTVCIAAIIGDQVGYLIGRKLGPRLFNRQDSRVLNPKNIDKAQAFFEHHGPKSIVLARFVPVVRAFVAVIAGAGRMKYRTFVTYNIAGGALWGIGVTLLGFYLGERPWVRDHIELVLILVVVLSLVPVVFEVLRHRRKATRPH